MRAGDSLSTASRSLASSLLDTLKTLGGLFKWLLIAVLAGIVLLYVATHFDEFKRLVADLINFINGLLGRRQAVTNAVSEESSATIEQPERRPFNSFVNPFAKGLKGWQGPQVVQHTFAALEAWAAQRGRVRAVDQTAMNSCAAWFNKSQSSIDCRCKQQLCSIESCSQAGNPRAKK